MGLIFLRGPSVMWHWLSSMLSCSAGSLGLRKRRHLVDKGWQQFVNHIAEREDARRRKESMPGRVLYAVLAAAIWTAVIGLSLQSLGWLPK